MHMKNISPILIIHLPNHCIINSHKLHKDIKKQIHIPLVADIHFDYRLALACIEAGADKIRLNPGNIGSRENVEKVVKACKEKHIPIRIGINGGSLEKDIHEKYGISSKKEMGTILYDDNAICIAHIKYG